MSGTEVELREPDLVGMMYGSAKAHDLQGDGRFAVHADPGDVATGAGAADRAGVTAC